MPRPIAIDLFAGAGGLSLGFEQAGFEVVAAIEVDPVHAAVHEFNFPLCVMVTRSVADLTGDLIRSQANLGAKEVDVVFGGPPCQGFSLMGHRSMEDPRNALVLDYLRLVNELDATYFVFENVKGITVGKHRRFLEEFIAEAGKRGYDVLLPWKVLDAADFDVPQHRERLILFGVKRGARMPSYPSPTCIPADAVSRSNLPTGPSCSDALDDIPDAELFADLLVSDAVRVAKWRAPKARYAREMHCVDETSWQLGHKRTWEPKLLTSSFRTEHSAISRVRFMKTKPGTVEPVSRFFRLDPQGLSNTLRAGTDSARGAFTSPRPIHPQMARCITVREMARLHGFPDWFRFHRTKWHGARQIGNAVPPPLARAIASSVMKALRIRVPKSSLELKLGDPRLLCMNMARAAEYYGVPAPIGKRDRKSGNTKRKQRAMNDTEAELIPTTAYLGFRELISV